MSDIDNIAKIKKLVEMLNLARTNYYNKSFSDISDYEYDELFDELKYLEDSTGFVISNSPTQTVGYEVKSKLVKHKHTHPMLSLDKTKSVEDLQKFAGDKDCLLMHKLDGLTILLTYEDGKLVFAETRGNGEIGEDVTHNAKVIENIPLTIGYRGTLEIEGEAIITYDDFEKINNILPEGSKYKNPRNLVSGSVRQLDSSIAARRHIKFIAWKVPKGQAAYSMLYSLKNIECLGFDIVPLLTYVNNSSDKDNIENMIENLKKQAIDKGYPIDGLVMAYNDIKYGESLGVTGHHPRHSLAFKFYDEESVTTLRDIEWSMGKTGILTPVAIFDSVDIDGTEVSRASLHNVSILKNLKLGIGDEITIYKANSVIPQVRENLTQSNSYKIPISCPVCGAKTQLVKDNDSEVLMCTNDNCKGKLLGKLTHFVSKNAMNIDGLSEATLEKCIQLDLIEDIDDIYWLFQEWEQLERLDGMGNKSVSKLMKAIENSKNTTLDRFLYALSIPLIGKTVSKDIAKLCNFDFAEFTRIMDHTPDRLMSIEGFGSTMFNKIIDWWNDRRTWVLEFANTFTFEKPEIVSANSKDLTGLTFVITGSLNHFVNRDAAKEEIEKLGGKVSGSVSAKTNYLINNDVNSTSGKNKKAMELGVKIISEDQLIEMMK